MIPAVKQIFPVGSIRDHGRARAQSLCNHACQPYFLGFPKTCGRLGIITLEAHELIRDIPLEKAVAITVLWPP